MKKKNVISVVVRSVSWAIENWMTEICVKNVQESCQYGLRIAEEVLLQIFDSSWKTGKKIRRKYSSSRSPGTLKAVADMYILMKQRVGLRSQIRFA